MCYSLLHLKLFAVSVAGEPGPMPGCSANPASSHAGRPTHGCQRGRALVQHVQLRRAVAAVLLAPCFTGVLLACELDVCLQALCSASLLFLNKGYCSSVSTSFKSTSLCKHRRVAWPVLKTGCLLAGKAQAQRLGRGSFHVAAASTQSARYAVRGGTPVPKNSVLIVGATGTLGGLGVLYFTGRTGVLRECCRLCIDPHSRQVA